MKTIIISVISVLIVAGAVLLALNFKQPETAGPGAAVQSNPVSPEKPAAGREPEVSKPTPPAEETAANLPLTEPDASSLLSSQGGSKLRIFNVKLSKNGFDRTPIVVNQGDTVQLIITASDGSYDVELSGHDFYLTIPLNEARSSSFDATKSGRFSFACKDLCPAGKAAVQGELVVNKVAP